MIKKYILTVLLHSKYEEFIIENLSTFVSIEFPNLQVMKNDLTDENGVTIITFASMYDVSFMTEILKKKLKNYFTLFCVDTDDNFDYYFGEDNIIDNLEDINEGLYFNTPLPSDDKINITYKYVDTNMNVSNRIHHIDNAIEKFNITYTDDGANIIYNVIDNKPIPYVNITFSNDDIEKALESFNETHEWSLDELLILIEEYGEDNLSDRQKECLRKFL